jgi:hypothetical protein
MSRLLLKLSYNILAYNNYFLSGYRVERTLSELMSCQSCVRLLMSIDNGGSHWGLRVDPRSKIESF